MCDSPNRLQLLNASRAAITKKLQAVSAVRIAHGSSPMSSESERSVNQVVRYSTASSTSIRMWNGAAATPLLLNLCDGALPHRHPGCSASLDPHYFAEAGNSTHCICASCTKCSRHMHVNLCAKGPLAFVPSIGGYKEGDERKSKRRSHVSASTIKTAQEAFYPKVQGRLHAVYQGNLRGPPGDQLPVGRPGPRCVK